MFLVFFKPRFINEQVKSQNDSLDGRCFSWRIVKINAIFGASVYITLF